MPSLPAQVTPYWRRLVAFVGYPFKGQGKWALLSLTAPALLFVTLFVGFAVKLGLTSELVNEALRVPLVGLIFLAPVVLLGIGVAFLAIFILTANYGFAVFSRTASGSTQPPSVKHAFTSGYLKSLKLILLMKIIFWVLGAVVAPIPVATGIRVLILIPGAMALLPVATMLLATTGHLRHAINPWQLTASIRRMGHHYLILLALMAGLSIGVSLVSKLLFWVLKQLVKALAIEELLAFLIWPLGGMQWAYFAIAIFHLLGHFAWQSRTPESDGDSKPQPPGGPETWATNEAGDAGASAVAEAATDWDTLIRRQIDSGRTTMAAQVVIDASRNDPTYRPADPDAYLPLARELRATGRGETAIRLCNGFHKRFPDHGDIPALYELIASIYSEDLEKPELARRIRGFVQHYHHCNDALRRDPE